MPAIRDLFIVIAFVKLELSAQSVQHFVIHGFIEQVPFSQIQKLSLRTFKKKLVHDGGLKHHHLKNRSV